MLILLPLLIISIFLEGTVTTLPLVLVCLLCMTILKRDWVVFPAAFFAGLILDVLVVHRLGGASIFFLLYVFLILLYQRKYEINSYPFVFTASFFGSFLFLLIFNYSNVFLQSVISSLIAVVLFALLKVSSRKI
jgi:cell shape-determining protein MreD